MRAVAVVLFCLITLFLILGRIMEWVPFAWLEILGSVTGAACVLLVIWRKILNFPVGILSCLAYMLFFAQDKLYAESGLQVVFIVLAAHGWIAWVQGRAEESPVSRAPLEELIVLVTLFPLVWLGLTKLLESVGGSSPMLDALVTTLSLAAQWFLNRRYIESWLGWIVVDQISVALFWSRGMYLTAGFYFILLIMCVAGLIEWRRNLNEKNG